MLLSKTSLLFRFTSLQAIITAKFNNKTAHIASMVRGQKSSKSTRLAPVKAVKHQPLRMPINRSYGFGDRNNNQSNNFSSNNSRTGGGGGYNPQQYNQQRLHQTQQNTQLQRQKSMGSSGASQPKDLREMLNSKKNQKIQQQGEVSKQSSADKQQQNVNQSRQAGPRAILGAAKPTAAAAKDFTNQTDSKKPTNSRPQQQSQTSQNALTKQTAAQQTEKQSMPPVGQKPQQRLNINQNTQQTAQPVAAQVPKTSSTQQPPSPQISSASLSNLASRLQLQQQQRHQQQQQQQLQAQELQKQQQQQQQLQAQQLQKQQQQKQQQQQQHPIISPQALTKADQSKNTSMVGLQNRLKVYHKPEYTNQVRGNHKKSFQNYTVKLK